MVLAIDDVNLWKYCVLGIGGANFGKYYSIIGHCWIFLAGMVFHGLVVSLAHYKTIQFNARL